MNNVRYGFVLFFQDTYPPTELYHPEVFLSQTVIPHVYTYHTYSKELAEKLRTIAGDSIVFACTMHDETYEVFRTETETVVERMDIVQKK